MTDAQTNEDILRVMGFIGFVSILVGAAIAVFDADLWLKSQDTYSNALTYAMGAFTLQGMSYFFYKLLLQDNMDSKAQWQRTQRVRDARLREMNSQFANAQLETELKMRQMQMEKQLRMLEENPDAYMAMSMSGYEAIPQIVEPKPQTFKEQPSEFNPPPKHRTDKKEAVNLGVDLTKEVPLTKDGKPDKRYKKE
tara:strand:- start:2278 stop:2862 length:585 start_codon:yes stop_codon:yes gene_type:complete